MSAKGPQRRTSTRDDWMTPAYVFEPLHAEFGFTLDVAADAMNHRLERWLSGPCAGEHGCPCGLCADWGDAICWMNPPYSDAFAWVQKAVVAATAGATVVALMPNNTDVRWFSLAWSTADEIRFVQGRIQFEPKGASGNTGGSVVIVWRPGLSTSRQPRVRMVRYEACKAGHETSGALALAGGGA